MLGAAALLLIAFAAVCLTFWGVVQGGLPEAQAAVVRFVLEQATGAQVQLAETRGSFLDTIELRDLRLQAEDTGSLHIERVRAELELGALRSQQQLVVRSLLVDAPELELRRRRDGQWLVSGLPQDLFVAETTKSEDAATPLSVKLVAMELSRGHIDIDWEDTSGRSRARLLTELSLQEWQLPAPPGGQLPPKLSFSAVVESAELHGIEVLAGQLELQLEGPLLEITRARFETRDAGQFDLDGRAELDLSNQLPELAEAAGELRFNTLDLSALSGKPVHRSQLNGKLDATLEATTPGTQIPLGERQIAFEVGLGPSLLGTEEVESARVRGQLWPGEQRWRVAEAEFSSELGNLSFHGAGDLDGAEELRLEVRALELAAVAELAERSETVRGRLDVDAQLNGTWSDLRGELALSASALDFDERGPVDAQLRLGLEGAGRYSLEFLSLRTLEAPLLEIESTGRSQLRTVAGGVELSELSLVGSGGELVIKGGIYPEHVRELSLQLKSLDLRTVDALSLSERVLGGKISGALSIDGPFAAPRIDGSVNWHQPRIGELRASALRFDIARSGQMHTGTLALDLGEESPLRLSATLPSEMPAPGADLPLDEVLLNLLGHPEAKVELNIEKLESGALARLLPERAETLAELGGQLSAELDLRADAQQLWLGGQARWIAPRLAKARAESAQLVLATRGADLHADLRVVDQSKQALRVTAQTPLQRAIAQPQAVLRDPATRAELQLDDLSVAWLLEQLQEASRDIERVGGAINGALTVQGGSTGPQLGGSLNLRDGELKARLLERSLGPIHGRLELSTSGLQVQELTIESDGGPATIDGLVGWSSGGLGRIALRAHLDEFLLTHIPLFESTLKGALTLDGDEQGLHLDGAVTLESSTLKLPDRTDPLLKEVRVLGLDASGSSKSIREGAGSEPSLLDRASAEVRIELAGNSRVFGQGADFDMEGGLRVVKQRGGASALLGTLQVSRGTYRFRGRSFDVEQGIASLTQRYPLDPDLSVAARHDVRDVTIRIEIIGRLSSPEFRLSSDPLMDETEILSYLLFRRPSEELGDSETAQLQTAATQVLSDVLLGDVGDAIAEVLLVDRVAVVLEDDTNPAIELEKRVTDTITVRYQRALRASYGDTLEVDWRFWKHFSLQSEVSTTGESGLDLIWSYDY